jgi:predicted nucleic acid-binding Zn ribbon protein
MRWDDEDDDEIDHDADHNGQDTTDECPYCGAAIYDDSVRCASCGSYLSQEDQPLRHGWWFIACAILCLIAALGWVLRF